MRETRPPEIELGHPPLVLLCRFTKPNSLDSLYLLLILLVVGFATRETSFGACSRFLFVDWRRSEVLLIKY
jgi:hypothetical protein